MRYEQLVCGRRGGVWAAIAGTLLGLAAVRSANAHQPVGGAVPLLDRLLGPAEAAPPGPARRADAPPGDDGHDKVATRPPAPRPADITAAEKRVREAYAAELQGVRDPVGRRKLFDALIEVAGEPTTPDPERWAAIELAREVAAEAGEATLVRRALETRVASFAEQDWLGPMTAFLQAAKNAGLKRGAPDLMEASLDVNREALAAAKKDPGRVANAREAIELAAKLLPELPPNDQDRFRPRLLAQQELTDKVTAICEQAEAARGGLQGNPDDHAANAHAGFAAAWAGDWVTAAGHLRRTKDRKLKAAAEREAAMMQPPAAAEAFGVAGAWWDAVAEDGQNQGAAILAPRPPPQPTSTVRTAIMVHAADLYRKALPGLQGLDRKEAEARIQKAAEAQRREDLVEESQKKDDDDSVIVVGPVFGENRFNAAEQGRADKFRLLGNAVAQGNGPQIARLQKDLTGIRTEWAGALHLQNRDASLPRKQQLITDILRRDPNFADGWLCDAYLAILAGDKQRARASLDKADGLMRRDPQRQVFCGQQFLDAAQASLMLGDIEGAEKVKQALDRRFPNNNEVKFLGARVDTEQRQFNKVNPTLRTLFREPNPSLSLAAEYAWFKAANPNEALRDPVEANKAIQLVLAAGQGPLWKALRAQAAVLAADGRWDDAIKTLDSAAEQAPLLFADDIAAQRAAYVKREFFSFTTIK